MRWTGRKFLVKDRESSQRLRRAVILEWICHLRLETVLLIYILQMVPFPTPSLRQEVMYCWGVSLWSSMVALFHRGCEEKLRDTSMGLRWSFLPSSPRLCFPRSLSEMGGFSFLVGSCFSQETWGSVYWAGSWVSHTTTWGFSCQWPRIRQTTL